MLLSKVTLGQSVPIARIIYFLLKVSFAKEQDRRLLPRPPVTICRGNTFLYILHVLFFYSENSFLIFNQSFWNGRGKFTSKSLGAISNSDEYYIRQISWGWGVDKNHHFRLLLKLLKLTFTPQSCPERLLSTWHHTGHRRHKGKDVWHPEEAHNGTEGPMCKQLTPTKQIANLHANDKGLCWDVFLLGRPSPGPQSEVMLWVYQGQPWAQAQEKRMPMSCAFSHYWLKRTQCDNSYKTSIQNAMAWMLES